VWSQKISIPPPWRVIGNSEGEGGLKGQNFKRELSILNWNFQRGGVFKLKKKPPWGKCGYFLEQPYKPEFFQAFFSQMHELCHNRDDLLYIFWVKILHPAVQIYDIHRLII